MRHLIEIESVFPAGSIHSTRGPMKKVMQAALLIATCLLLASGGAAQNGAQNDDRTELLRQLEHSRKLVVDATVGFSATQWNFKPAADKWSAKDVVEHLALTEDYFYQLADKLMKAPAAQPVEAEKGRAADATLANMYRDRSKKAQAPDMLRPVNTWPTPEDTLKAFLERRDKSIKFVKETPGDMRAHYQQASSGPRDAHTWLIGMSAHVERHVKQIEEIKASPNFPK